MIEQSGNTGHFHTSNSFTSYFFHKGRLVILPQDCPKDGWFKKLLILSKITNFATKAQIKVYSAHQPNHSLPTSVLGLVSACM